MKPPTILPILFSMCLVSTCLVDRSAQVSAPAHARPIAQRHVAGAVVTTVDNGDFVLPRFSPDGRTLAYVSVTVANGTELDEVHLLDIATRNRRKLIDARAAKKCATYSATVVSIEWTGRNRLRVSMSDGDVDVEHLTFDTATGRIVERKHASADEPGALAATSSMTGPELELRSRAVRVFGDSIAGSFDQAIMGSGFVTQDGRIVGRGLGPILEGDVWLLDPESRTRTALLPRPGFGWSSDLVGGFDAGASLVLITSVLGNAHFVRVDPSVEAVDLGVIEGVSNDRDVRVLRVSGARAVVLLQRHHNSERGSNSLVFVDGDTLVESADYAEIVDADVDRAMENVAFSVWTEGNKRSLVIRKLNSHQAK